MSTIHPHWLATPDEDRSAATPLPEPVRIAERVPPPPRPQRRMRSAAIVGVFLACGIGYAFFEGLGGLVGQLSGDGGASAGQEVSIVIGVNGIVPRKAAVRPGQTIVWRNDQELPHILQSPTLKDARGEALYTRAIFPGSEERFTVSPSQPAGSNTYSSITAQDVAGEIVVGGAAAAALQPVPPASPPALGSTDGIPLLPGGDDFGQPAPAVTIPPSSPADSYDTAPAASQDALLPHNPYTADRLGSWGTDAAPASPRPSGQPSTGPELWFALAIALPFSVWALRRANAAHARVAHS